MTAPIDLDLGALKALPLPMPADVSDKNARGRLLVMGGDAELPGAAVLCGVGALRAGAGKLQFAAREEQAVALGFAVPEARVIAVAGARTGGIPGEAANLLNDSMGSADCIAVGPGMMDEASAASLIQALLRASKDAAFLIDAAAMTALKDLRNAGSLCAGRAVLTPHHGEMATLMGISKDTVADRPLETALSAASRFNAVVALKSAETFIATPDGRTWRNAAGTVGLGVCGSGDVLAGIIAGLLARGAAPEVAAVWGVHVHAQIGRHLAMEVGPLGYLARDLLEFIPRVLAQSALP